MTRLAHGQALATRGKIEKANSAMRGLGQPSRRGARARRPL